MAYQQDKEAMESQYSLEDFPFRSLGEVISSSGEHGTRYEIVRCPNDVRKLYVVSIRQVVWITIFSSRRYSQSPTSFVDVQEEKLDSEIALRLKKFLVAAWEKKHNKKFSRSRVLYERRVHLFIYMFYLYS